MLFVSRIQAEDFTCKDIKRAYDDSDCCDDLGNMLTLHESESSPPSPSPLSSPSPPHPPRERKWMTFQGIDWTMTSALVQEDPVSVNGVDLVYVPALKLHLATGVSWGSQDFSETGSSIRRIAANADPVSPSAYSFYLVSDSEIDDLAVDDIKISGPGNTVVTEYQRYTPFELVFDDES